MGMGSTLIIIPAWNEQASIGATLAQVLSNSAGMDVLVVDDGSTDQTASVAAAAGATVLRLPFNLGVGAAMRTGFEYARRHGYQRAIQVDADGQHDPADIGAVLAGLDRADICIGARFAGRGEYGAKGPRRWAMSLLAVIVSRVAHTKLTDITSGFRAANRKAIEQYCRHFPAEYLGDTVDSLVMAVRSGCTVTQVPVEMRARQAGTPSSGSLRSTVYLARALFSLLLALTRRATRREDAA